MIPFQARVCYIVSQICPVITTYGYGSTKMQLQITDPSTQASQLVKDSSAPGAGVALSRISFDCCDKYISILLVRRFNKVEKVLYSAHIVVVGVDEISLM